MQKYSAEKCNPSSTKKNSASKDHQEDDDQKMQAWALEFQQAMLINAYEKFEHFQTSVDVAHENKISQQNTQRLEQQKLCHSLTQTLLPKVQHLAFHQSHTFNIKLPPLGEFSIDLWQDEKNCDFHILPSTAQGKHFLAQTHTQITQNMSEQTGKSVSIFLMD